MRAQSLVYIDLITPMLAGFYKETITVLKCGEVVRKVYAELNAMAVNPAEIARRIDSGVPILESPQTLYTEIGSTPTEDWPNMIQRIRKGLASAPNSDVSQVITSILPFMCAGFAHYFGD